MSRESLSEQNGKEFLIHSYNEEETESDSTNLVWKLFEIRHAKPLTLSEFARYQGTSEENWSENVKEFCVGKTENCTSILKVNQGQNIGLDICTAKRNEGVESSLEVKANEETEGSAKAKIWHFTVSSWCSWCENGAWKQNRNYS